MARVIQLQLGREVQQAREAQRPIVAREATLVAHGLPYPENHLVAVELETAVRDRGAVPATIAVIDGQPCIGLEPEQLEAIAKRGREIAKAGATDHTNHHTHNT